MRSDAERYKSLLLCLETNKVKAWWCFNHISQIIAFIIFPQDSDTRTTVYRVCVWHLHTSVASVLSSSSTFLNGIGNRYGVIPKKFIFKVVGSLPPSITHLSQTTNVVSATLPRDKFNEIPKKFLYFEETKFEVQ